MFGSYIRALGERSRQAHASGVDSLPHTCSHQTQHSSVSAHRMNQLCDHMAMIMNLCAQLVA